MRSKLFALAAITFLSNSTVTKQLHAAKSSPVAGMVSTVFFTAVDADIAADFALEILGAKDAEIFESSLSEEQRWLQLPNSQLQLRFTTAMNIDELERHYARVIRFDRDMSVYTDWMNTHGAIQLADLTPVMQKLQSKGEKFLGPIKKDGGLYQIVVRLPGAGYLTLETATKPKKEFLSRTINWDLLVEVSRTEVKNELGKSKSYGGEGGIPFDDTNEIVGNDGIRYVEAEWNSGITKLTVGYRSGLRLKHGKTTGKIGKRFDLDDDEIIQGAIVCQAKIHGALRVKSLILTTNSARRFEFGTFKKQDDCYWALIPSGHHIVGFFGNSSDEIDRIGLIHTPTPTLDHSFLEPM